MADFVKVRLVIDVPHCDYGNPPDNAREVLLHATLSFQAIPRKGETIWLGEELDESVTVREVTHEVYAPVQPVLFCHDVEESCPLATHRTWEDAKAVARDLERAIRALRRRRKT